MSNVGLMVLLVIAGDYLMFRILDIFKKSKAVSGLSPEKTFLTLKYDHFKAVLTGNNKALDIITDLEHIFYEDQPVSLNHVRTQAENLIESTCRIAEDLNALAGAKFLDLFEAVEKVGLEVRQGPETKKAIMPTRLVLPLDRIGQEHVPEVGGKAANLGEILSRVKLPVPRGFAVTAYACQVFLEFNHFPERIEKALKNLEVNDTEKLMQVSEEIRSFIISGRIPPDLEQDLLRAIEELKEKTTRTSAPGRQKQCHQRRFGSQFCRAAFHGLKRYRGNIVRGL